MVDQRRTGDDSPVTRSESESKRETTEIEERSELCHKRVKVRDLEHSGGRSGKENVYVVTESTQKTLDCNATAACSGHPNKEGSFKMRGRENLVGSEMLRGHDLDLNAEDVSSSANADHFHCRKSIGKVKSRNDFVCESSVVPLEERAQKKNDSLAYSRGESLFRKPLLRKGKNEMMNKKIEFAKKEQADRFAKVAAPTGLLNGLNPGIINHVRNGKQVYSIIEALVRSKKNDNSPSGDKHGSQMKSGERNVLESTDCLNGKHQEATLNALSALPNESVFTDGNGNSCMVETRKNFPLNSKIDCNDNIVAQKLLSDTNTMYNDASANLTSVTALSIKGANVASQWLELLNQDTKGRLAALRSSKKRVREVIQTEFPCLISRESSCNPKDSVPSQSDQTIARAHCARWSLMFDQMDKTLSEDESKLVSWCKQVREMQLQCERGIIKYNMPFSSLQNENRQILEKDPDRDLAVRAAAASIYSTSNFISSMENLPCC